MKKAIMMKTILLTVQQSFLCEIISAFTYLLYKQVDRQYRKKPFTELMDFKNLVLAVKSNLFTYFLQSVYCTDQSSLVISFFTNKIEFAHPKRAHIFSIVVIWLVPIQVSTKLLLIQIKLGYQGKQLAQTGSCNSLAKKIP